MKTALFAAILLVAISAPAAYASTLQLVTENGNVFSIDYDEILATWELYHGNSTARTALNGTVLQEIDNLQTQINDLIAKLNSNSTDTEIDKLEERVDDLLTQLNSNSTSTETEIERLGDLIANLTSNSDVAIDRLEQLIANLDNATESEITELNELLDELETDLLTQIDDLEAGTGVGAGALGSSGRLVSIPTEGILVTGVHTVRDTRGTVEPTTAYFYPEYDFAWVTLIRENEAYDEYVVPSLNAEYSVNSGAGTLRETSTTLTSELNVRGLEPYTAWALLPNGTDAATYAGVTNSAGDMLIPRTANDGVTITRTANFTGSLDLNIPDRGSIRDTITVSEHGTVNDLHVTITSSSSSYRAQLISPDGTNYQVNTSGGSGSRTYAVDAVGEQINGDWTLVYKATGDGRYSRILQDWTLAINHGSAGKVQSVSGSGSQYDVVVGSTLSGTFGLDLMNVMGIKDSYKNLLDNSLQTGLDEIHVVSGGQSPNSSDPLHVYSIERHDPLSILSTDSYPQFLVTFNKRVENVDVADFVGGYGTTSQITRTITTPLDVWYGESSVTVPQSGTRTASNTNSFELTDTASTATSNIAHTNSRLSSKEVASVSVTVDMDHTFAGDVKIDLIAPDGTRETIRNDSGGGGQYTGETFTNANNASLESFIGVSARGTWSLVVEDTYPSSDNGRLDGWSLTLGYGDSTVTYVEHEPESSTTSISFSSSYIVTNATLTLNAVSADFNADEWELSLTTPSGINIELADADSTHLDYSGGVHTFYLGEIIGVFPGSGTWRLNAVDLKTDHDPTNPNTDEPEGTIDSWTLDLDRLSKKTVREVLPHGSDGTEYLVEIDARSNVNGYVIFLKGDTDVSAINSGETYDTRDTVFAPDPHEYYDKRVGSVPSTPHVRGIAISNSTSNSVTFQVTFSETVTGVNATDFIVIENGSPELSGPQESTYSNAPNMPIRSVTITPVSDTIPISGYYDGVVDALALNVDISHTRIGDLEVELVGPDGTKRIVHNNRGGTTVDLMSSFTPSFAGKPVNGNWTLQVRDNGSTQSFGTINSWSLDFSYEDTPTYEELLVVETQKGVAYTWKEFLSGNYNLRTYPDAPVHHTPCATNGIMIDGYNGGTACITNGNVNTLIYTSGAYMKYPVTVDVYISNIRMTGPGKSDVSMRYIDGSYKAGSAFYIPIIPGMTTLKMNIAGSEASVDLADIAPAVSIISLEPATDTSYVVGTRRASAEAVSTVSFFAGEDKEYYMIITLDVKGSMTYSVKSERTKGWMNEGGSVTARNKANGGGVYDIRGSDSFYANIRFIENGAGFADALSNIVPCERFTCYMTTTADVYINGELTDSYVLLPRTSSDNVRTFTSDVWANGSVDTVNSDLYGSPRKYQKKFDMSSTTATLKGTQGASGTFPTVTLEETIKMHAKTGEFVELVFSNKIIGFSINLLPQFLEATPFYVGGGCGSLPTCHFTSTKVTPISLCANLTWSFGGFDQSFINDRVNWCNNHINSDVFRGSIISNINTGYVLVI